MQEQAITVIYLFIPWLVFGLSGVVFFKLFSWAKKKKTSALIFGALVQMFMPDPYAERTIKVVTQEEVKKHNQNDTDEEDSKLDRNKD